MPIMVATWRDFSAIQRLEKICFPQDAWPFWDVFGVLTLPNVIRLKAVDEEQVVGFVAADVRPRENLAWIATIGVLPAYRRRGIGAALLAACEARLTVARVRLCVRLSNYGAQNLYRQFGYQPIDQWRNYYRGGETALVMEKIRNGYAS
ncbi:MAG: N-acetyltransferase [Anaerolineae bacterium]|nr:MAG: N-acetyltransferase [Anaerolineae bacterium]